jgi:hypothetical protein
MTNAQHYFKKESSILGSKAHAVLGIIYSLGSDGPADPGPACPVDTAEAGDLGAGDSPHPILPGPAVSALAGLVDPVVTGPSVPARDTGAGGPADPVIGTAVPAAGPVDPVVPA